jgi:uncharacterized protein YbaA (DUF1428 family)
MPFITGSIAAVPVADREKYVEHAAAVWPLFAARGATRMVETWGVDVPKGDVTDFRRAVEAKDDEAVTFSWIAWPDRATADEAFRAMQSDPAAMPEMPFDGSRMIYGGFAPVFQQGEDAGAGYVQGFALAVPEKNRDAYVAMAAEVWPMFSTRGALGTAETWGEDVPRGRRTDFYRATKAEPGEVAVFSWIAWPDRATCDAAAAAMEAEMGAFDMSSMPFDGKRMMWAGFEPLYDSGARA